MKKNVLLVSLVILVVAIVLAIVWLITLPADTKNQKAEPINPELTFKDTQTQILKSENFLEKIGASTDPDVTSILKRKNPLDVFEAMRQQTTRTETGANSKLGDPVFQNLKQPKVFSVSPNRVRNGDSVTITGENFTPTNNVVFLKDGPAQQRFDGLPSYDGKTITFVYQPPEIRVMTESEIRALPVGAVSQIEKPIEAAGKTLADALKSYSEQGISNESELGSALEKNGHQLNEIYNYFFVKVENSQGSGMSSTALLHGLPKTASDIAANSKLPILSVAGQKLNDWLKEVVPTVYAQMNGGGFFATVMICTCGDGYMDFMMDYSGGGSGLWVFSWGFMADAGSGFGGGMWLGGYNIMAGQCSIYIGIDCLDIPGNAPSNPWGSAI